MRTATKKPGILLFMLAGFTPLLFVLLFSFKQQMIRHRMERNMEELQLHTITIATQDIHWAEKGKEIVVEGRLFDVASLEHKNGVTVFHGLFDDEETGLEEAFRQGWSKNLTDQNQLLAKIFQCLNGFYCTGLPDIKPFSQHTIYSLPAPAPELPVWVKMILTPPPQA